MATDYQAIMLALAKGLPWASITNTFGCSRNTIDRASRVMRDQGFDRTQILALSPSQVEELFPDRRSRDDQQFLQPDFEKIMGKKRSGKRVTLKVEHELYCKLPTAVGQQHYSYKQFCRLFSRFVDVNDLTAQITHIPGEAAMVDWSGDRMKVTDPISGKTQVAEIFTASLPYSGLVFAGAFESMKMRCWLDAHKAAFEYFGGVPRLVTPDNASTATNQLFRGLSVRDTNPQYFQFSEHYGFGVAAARPVKPRDKGSVEKHVDIVQQWVISYLADEVFYSFEQLNAQIFERIEWINNRRGFRGKDQCRYDLFRADEQAKLQPLPEVRWSWSTWRASKVGPNYHIRVDKHFYSVPWKYAGQTVHVQIFDDHLVIFADNQVIAEHTKMLPDMGYTTNQDHVPANHKDLATKWNRERIESWASSMGAATAEIIRQMFNNRTIEAHAYSSTLAVLAMAKQFSRAQLEQACQRLLDRKEIPSTRKVLEELKWLKSHPQDTFTSTQAPLSTDLSPSPTTKRPRTSDTSYVRGKKTFKFAEEE